MTSPEIIEIYQNAIIQIATQTGTGSGVASAINAISGVVVTTQAKVRPGDAVSLYLTGTRHFAH